MRILALFALVGAGCLGEATINTPDLSGSVLPDLSQANNNNLDMAGSGDGGGTNCVMLNDCEKKCSSDPKPPMCIAACRAAATPSALTKEAALQMCFGQYCPQGTDAGTPTICSVDMGPFSADCTTCISNSQIAPANPCTPKAAPSECHNCYNQATACVADK